MNNNQSSSFYTKKPTIILIVLTIWLILIIGIIWPWIHQINQLNLTLPILAYVSAGIWWLVLLWTLYHLAFQITSLFIAPPKKRPPNSHLPSVAILYPTCDDFNPNSCKTCLDQDYENYRVFVCDDSTQTEYKNKIREFYQSNSDNFQLVTRPENKGFKAGNLNHAIKNHVTEDFILIVDADQFLPIDYLSQLVSNLPIELEQTAFIQAAHETMIEHDSSRFQIELSPGTALYYFRDLALRQSYGLIPMLGHGVLVPRKTWERIGKFPEVVSEDFAFTLRAANLGQQGLYVEQVRSYETFPYDFGGYLLRLKKYAGATAELFQQELIPFLTKSASNTEKCDFFMQLLGYAIMPFVVVNGFLGAYVSYKLWHSGVPSFYPVLPYIYIWLLLSFLALNVSVTEGWGRAFKFYFWATAIYTSALPLGGWHFTKHFFTRPVFKRTPKNGEKTAVSFSESFAMIILGVVALIFSLNWISPFSPVLAGQGIAYLSFPLYGQLNSSSKIGQVARLVIFLPGIFMLFAIYAMWNWGRF